MPRRKKKVTEMTDDELVRKLFPKPVVEEMKRIAHENDEKPLPKHRDSSKPE